ncbi:uncharacterized protein LOC123258838 [Cotesia glomerata]|uniref:uncharacterized protein LOC123258838 n=1 Tax=Cotesia glomerata TaxID=32391 RepID=UPI001D017C0A|nr:uncharacterized protein LOC123258838 [Cotesia glomerata]
MLFAILLVFVLQFLNSKGDYDLFMEDVDNPAYNEEYFTKPDFYLDNNNGIVLNFSIIKQLPEGTEGRFIIKRASMGEYVVDTGIDVTMGLCDGIEEPILIGPILKVLGFTVDNCPPGVGVYQFEGYKLPKENLPDDFPPNNYKVTLEIFYGEQIILIIEVLVKII